MVKLDKNKIDMFFSKLGFYRGKYGEKFKSEWQTKEHYLTYNKLLKHFSGQTIIGAFSCQFTKCFVIDIDIHEEEQVKNLMLYKQIVNKSFGIESFISKSARGLHLYYLLDNYFDSNFLKEKLLNKLKSDNFGREIPKNIEIYPTSTHFIKLPFSVKENNSIMIDMNGRFKVIFDKIEQVDDFVDYVLNLPERHIADIIGYNLTPDLTDFKKIAPISKKQGLEQTEWGGVEEYYRQTYPDGVQGGNSNQFILDMTFICWKYHLSLEDTQRTIENLIKTNGNPKKDTQGRNLYRRIRCRYNQVVKNSIVIKKKLEKKQEYEEIPKEDSENIAKIVSECPKSTQFRKGLLKFLENVYRWNKYIRSLNKYQALFLNKIFPFFYNFAYKQKLLPLPYTLMTGWSKRYFIYIDYLRSVGVITLEKNYSKNRFCKHFLLHLVKVIKRIRECIHQYTENEINDLRRDVDQLLKIVKRQSRLRPLRL